LLDDERVSLNARDDEGHTVLQYAFASPDPLVAKKALRDLFPDIHVPERQSLGNDESFNNALCLQGGLRMVSPVLRAGADPNEPDDKLGNFGLHWALMGTELDFQLPIGPRGIPKLLRLSCHPVGNVSIDAVRACFELGDAAVDACNRQGETPLHLVVSGGHGLQTLDLMLAQGADPNLMDEKGEIAAHRFARHVVSDAPAMLAKLLEASKGKVLAKAVFNNDRRGLSPDAKMELEVCSHFIYS
jgi:ankyrin repeat protein